MTKRQRLSEAAAYLALVLAGIALADPCYVRDVAVAKPAPAEVSQ